MASVSQLGGGGRSIDDTSWQVEHYTSADSLWGHPQLRGLVTGGAAGDNEPRSEMRERRV